MTDYLFAQASDEIQEMSPLLSVVIGALFLAVGLLLLLTRTTWTSITNKLTRRGEMEKPSLAAAVFISFLPICFGLLSLIVGIYRLID